MLKQIAPNPITNNSVYKKKNMKVKPVEKIIEPNPYKNKQSDWSRNIIRKGIGFDERT